MAARQGKDKDTEPAARAAPATGLPRQAGSFAHYSVAQEIGRRIVGGDYPPGTILPNEAEWSDMFGTSRSVVREAVKMLMSKNLLVSRTKINCSRCGVMSALRFGNGRRKRRRIERRSKARSSPFQALHRRRAMRG